ncbi:MAG: AzlD domain-containing protein [Burkholderiaceae bacterium]|nr:AzlD domain-containing protein [Burkholderiaceae bacterium]NDH83256.1 AzlD domain-containing protein [Burkholderiaceae bacterium]
MTPIWIATLVTSFICFVLKLLGYSLPESILNKPIVQRINSLIPIALLSALVAVQTLGMEKSVQIDHRLAGVVVAGIALRFKASFPVMMLLAAITSAAIYNL